jgi:ribonuclease HI
VLFYDNRFVKHATAFGTNFELLPTAPTSSIVIFTDGACSGNPGPGGWGSIVALDDGTVHELGGSQTDTTNNRMELAAAIRALQLLQTPPSCSIVLYTDSVYVIRGITQWIWGWRSRGWKSSEGKDVANRDMWEELSRQVARLKPATIDWKYVRGHSGYAGNERCDQIAVGYATGKPERLYVGSLDGYFVDLTDLPADEGLPEQKKTGTGKSGGSGGGGAPSGPVSYLSYRNGVVVRHSTWADCERNVKGQPNVKFKKAKSPREEAEILSSWGLDPSTNIEE